MLDFDVQLMDYVTNNVNDIPLVCKGRLNNETGAKHPPYYLQIVGSNVMLFGTPSACTVPMQARSRPWEMCLDPNKRPV